MQKNEHLTDEILVKTLQDGDKTALITLVKRYHKLFCGKAHWMVNNREVAKDIAQESWVVIINKISTLKEPKRFKFWAYRIVCNRSTDWLRQKSIKHFQTLEYDTEISSFDKVYTEHKHLKLLLAINELPKHQKTVIRLFYLESYNLKEIGDLLNISVGTVKSRLFHAREKLKTILKHNHYEN